MSLPVRSRDSGCPERGALVILKREEPSLGKAIGRQEARGAVHLSRRLHLRVRERARHLLEDAEGQFFLECVPAA